MGKKVIRLTENELKEIVKLSIENILNETNIVAPALADTVIAKTDSSIENGEGYINMNGTEKDPNISNDKARVLRNVLLTHYILQEIGNVHLVFLKYDRAVDKRVSVAFDMEQVQECTNSGIKLQGIMKVPTNNGMIDKSAYIFYDFVLKKFTMYTYYWGNRKKEELTLPIKGIYNQKNLATFNRLIYLIEDFLNVCDICANEMRQMTSAKEYYQAITQKMNERYRK